MTQIIHEELSRKIIGAAMEVLNELKPGLDEKLYERALIIELKRGGHHTTVQRAFPVFFRGELIGSLVPDLIVDDAVIVDPKVVAVFTETQRRANDWVFKYHRARPRTSDQLQKCATRMEASTAPAEK
jgi:GxxExxY protein